MLDWNIDKARELYGVRHWSGGYFDIGENGHVFAMPEPATAGSVDLLQLVSAIEAHGLKLPVLLRFPGILRDRAGRLHRAFGRALEAHGCARDRYTSAYPIKVNQRRNVVEQLLNAGDSRVGIEVGSKAELLIALAKARADQIIICNGYKDREYIRLAAIARQMGIAIFIVIERIIELEQTIEVFSSLAVDPLLGVRIRLATMGVGKWQNSGGEKSKFGLLAAEVLKVSAMLKQHDLGAALRMMHFHMGSQLTNIEDIRRGVREAAYYFAGLCRDGFAVDYLNVGGGLGIDYEGTNSTSFCSMNYSLDDYADVVVGEIKQVCQSRQLAFPHLVTEVGRAMSAHHAVLVTNVIDVERVTPLIEQNVEVRGNGRDYYQQLQAQLQTAREQFCAGGLGLQQRAKAEQDYFAACERLRNLLETSGDGDGTLLQEIHEKLADKVFCNFSLFQSLPDAWAIQQIFPVMPLHRLASAPTSHGIIQDITCDSDGVIEQYVGGGALESSLPLHEWSPESRYFLGIFLVGAYQETLGDIHNLFGRVNSVDVEVDKDGGYRLLRPERGDDKASVIASVNYDSASLLEDISRRLDERGVESAVKQRCRELLEESFASYTYLTE